MGIFRRARDLTVGGSPAAELLRDGMRRRAAILAVEETGHYLGVARNPVCRFNLTVSAGGRFWDAEVRQEVPHLYLSVAKPGSYVVVRVSPEDEQRVAIEWGVDPDQPLETPPAEGLTEDQMIEAAGALDDKQLQRLAAANRNASEPMTDPASVEILTVVEERPEGRLTLLRLRLRVVPESGAPPFECDYRALCSDRTRAMVVPKATFPGMWRSGDTTQAEITLPPA